MPNDDTPNDDTPNDDDALAPAAPAAPAAPCPTCRRVPEVTAEQFGRVVRCRGCGTRFRAAPAPPSVPTDGPPADGEPPKTAARPPGRRRHATDENPYDDGYARFEEEHTPGRVVALATMHFVYCGLLSVVGILSSVFVEVYPKALPGPDIARGTKTFVHVTHGLMVLGALLPLVAGVRTLGKRPTARVWTIVALAAAGLLLVLNLVQVVLNLPTFTGATGETSGVMCGVMYHMLFWLGYLIPVGVLLMSATKRMGESPAGPRD